MHHYRAYGAWSDAVKDYIEQGIMDWMGTPQFRALMRIEEPYEYRDRLTMPKLMLNASGDQFFLPDSSQFYFDELRARSTSATCRTPSHSLDKTRCARRRCTRSMPPWSRAPQRPQIKWTFERDGSIKVVSKQLPSDVQLWQAVNPTARNFRLDAIGPAYTEHAARAARPEHLGRQACSRPPTGWTAFFVELTFAGTGKYPLKLTTGVRVLPDKLPYAAPVAKPRTQAQ